MNNKVTEQRIINLVQYGIDCGMTDPMERIYATNLLLDIYGLAGFESGELPQPESGKELEEILAELLADACERGIIEDSVTERDLFDTRLMNCLMPRPGQVVQHYRSLYQNSPVEATDYFYKLSQDCDYIRRYRIRKDRKWTVDSEYGTLDITINLSKPEKDPKAIAAARTMTQSHYPKCQLCLENLGYAGRMNHPARQTLRVVPVTLTEEDWYMQYSPYVYYNEHCIVFCGEHRPMKISRETFERLFDFVDELPHYFLGSNADLPIVGGSILTHDHFQGGHYEFAMERAQVEESVQIAGYEDVETGIVKWPMSVLRLRGRDRKRVTELAGHVLDTWRDYTDEEAYIYAQTEQEDGTMEPHNTITPIARMRDGQYEMDLVLRNNITTEEHPLGVYHPHQELHHIKKENIGLIEVMGLAVLPARLKDEMAAMKKEILRQGDFRANPLTEAHAEWLQEIQEKYPELHSRTEQEVEQILEQEVGQVFIRVLEDAGVYKNTPEGREHFRRFVNAL